jgi:tRNA(Ile)-lysidine synthase
MQTINSKIKSFLKKHNLDNKDLIYLVGFSGGYDSMCLLDLLRKVAPKNKIVALHLNHKWRGEESDREEINCKEFCQKIGVEFYSENLPANIPHTETAARDARYKFFERCAKNFNSKIIFTAHNKNDNAETLIYRICTGTGVSGLQGISENREIYYRPLLSSSREEIEDYCKKSKLTPNNDSSNSDTKYKRNYIRAEIMPALTKVNANLYDNLQTLSDVAKEETEIVEEYLKYITEKITKDGKILTQKFLKLSEPVKRKLVYNLFISHNLDYDRKKILTVLDFIKENSASKSGKTCSLTSDLWIFASEKFAQVISKTDTTPTYIDIRKEGEYETENFVFEIEKFTKDVKRFPQSEEDAAYVDLSKLDFNFELRTRQEGDIIQPYGLDGSQKLKKYLNTKKIPNHEKDTLLFLAQGKEILWAINLGISDKIKVVKNPTHRLKIKRKGSNGN